MKKPTRAKILEWYKYRFPRNFGKSFDKSYMNEWIGRFKSPQLAWGYSDIETRKSLKKMFKRTFGKLRVSDNLYNKEWNGRYEKW